MAGLGLARLGNTINMGAGEVRVAALGTVAMTQAAHTVGAIQDTTLDVTTSKVEAKAGFPQVIVATFITEQGASLKATLMEQSASNLSLVLGNGLLSATASVSTTMTSTETIGATSIPVAEATGIVAGDKIIIYPEGKPEDVHVAQVVTVVANEVTISVGLPKALDGATSVIKVHLSKVSGTGGLQGTKYFTAVLVSKDQNGVPIVTVFWKVSAAGAASLAGNNTAVTTLPLELVAVAPSVEDTSLGGALEAYAALINQYPLMYRFAAA